MMKTKVIDTINKYRMFSRGDTVLVALSGGADSMCLTDILCDISEEFGIIVKAAHVNHCIRGREADLDQKFVEEYCASKGIELHVLKINVPEIAEKKGESIELCARNVRYDFFSSLSADIITTAHTGSDRIETMLMNLARGTSLNGLCSIPPVRDNIVRPLIDCTRNEIEDYCKEKQISFVTDSTNLEDEYTRNKIRHHVVPVLTEINSSFERNALRCIDSLIEDNSFLKKTACDEYMKRVSSDGKVDITGHFYDEVILKRVIVEFFDSLGIRDYENRHINYIIENRNSDFSICLPTGVRFSCKKGFLFCDLIKNSQENFSFSEKTFVKGENFVFDTLSGRVSVTWSDVFPDEIADVVVADADKIGYSLYLRPRKAGDEISLGKRRCTKPLRKLYSELKIPSDIRDKLLLIADDTGLIFAEYAGLDAKRALNADTKNFMIIKTEYNTYE
ncbi:MAG: tRNA lysidine(34) synthetase TilS [Clostridia bacterium]|nr:tRNA lysidine(34) synthetase TilS [Clostridia bacterium]